MSKLLCLTCFCFFGGEEMFPPTWVPITNEPVEASEYGRHGLFGKLLWQHIFVIQQQ